MIFFGKCLEKNFFLHSNQEKHALLNKIEKSITTDRDYLLPTVTNFLLNIE